MAARPVPVAPNIYALLVLHNLAQLTSCCTYNNHDAIWQKSFEGDRHGDGRAAGADLRKEIQSENSGSLEGVSRRHSRSLSSGGDSWTKLTVG
jgi:hypothetical protein